MKQVALVILDTGETPPRLPLTGAFHKLANISSNLEALAFGQPNFFTPRFPNPYLAVPGAAGATSFYDTTPLRGTLERLASFDLINGGNKYAAAVAHVEGGQIENWGVGRRFVSAAETRSRWRSNESEHRGGQARAVDRSRRGLVAGCTRRATWAAGTPRAPTSRIKAAGSSPAPPWPGSG